MNTIHTLAARPAVTKTVGLAVIATGLYLSAKLGITPMDNLGHWVYRGG